ncbi:Multiple EGF-like-domain protein 3 precursor [Sandaracinus amylolyticus]|uniref:Multiple EGF-like-domain protein 3 n=1 Tax=Sandaracinus amylolyticus TaxID=927083 RepID=A0A0F6YHX1_9BACT|nr:Multiple EGF-like-domain protein 3 precursor [Sandaracinus amylolyticus]
MNARARIIAALLVGLALQGCQLIVDFDRSRIVEGDAGVDAGAADAGGGGMDAGSDAGGDDAGTDAAMDDAAMDDAGSDAAMDDAGSDAAVAMTCGNGTEEGTEACDDGNTVTEAECPYGSTPPCMICDATCEHEIERTTAPRCGDGDTDAPQEDCDDGNTTTERCAYGTATCTVCDATCQDAAATGPTCGDGTVDAPQEECEPPSTATCDASCQDVT